VREEKVGRFFGFCSWRQLALAVRNLVVIRKIEPDRRPRTFGKTVFFGVSLEVCAAKLEWSNLPGSPTPPGFAGIDAEAGAICCRSMRRPALAVVSAAIEASTTRMNTNWR
jgi:hypothetical protein